MRYFLHSLCFLMVAELVSSCAQGSSGSANPSQSIRERSGNICSDLSFYNYPFQSDEFPFEVEAFKLALNITGSFEGNEQWQNLTNDFDGQGLSMGLINQTLGTGSLQPLLIKARNQHMPLLKKTFSGSHLKSLLGMLKNFENLKSRENPEDLPSILDREYDELAFIINSRTSESVKWAQKNLYKFDGTFVPTWKKELQQLISMEDYVGIQIEAAWILHRKALSLQRSLGVFELRAYLLMFDIVVQNGNLYMVDWRDYEEWLDKTPAATNTDKLEKIVDLRMRHVKPQYVNNVRIRKRSLIHGQGRVHGANREYEKEYCFDKLMQFPGSI